MNGIYKLITVAMFVLAIATGAWLYITWKNASEENEERKLDESRLIYRRDSLKKEKEYKTEYYTRLVHDEEFAERVIREKLGFAGENEIVFRFKDATAPSVTTSTSTVTPKTIEYKPSETTPQTDDKKDAEISTIAPQEQPQKSFLRRLFSREKKQPSQTNHDIAPQITIDMSEKSSQNEANFPIPKTSNETDIPKIGVDFSNVKPKSDDNNLKQKTLAPRAEMYLPKANTSNKRTSNSIRFKAD